MAGFSLLLMAGVPFFRCPGCGSLLTSRASVPGTRECLYCACLFPVERTEDILAWIQEPVPGPGPVTLAPLRVAPLRGARAPFLR